MFLGSFGPGAIVDVVTSEGRFSGMEVKQVLGSLNEQRQPMLVLREETGSGPHILVAKWTYIELKKAAPL